MKQLCEITLINQSRVYRILTTTQKQRWNYLRNKHHRGYVLTSIHFKSYLHITIVKSDCGDSIAHGVPIGNLDFYAHPCGDEWLIVTDSMDRLYVHPTEEIKK